MAFSFSFLTFLVKKILNFCKQKHMAEGTDHLRLQVVLEENSDSRGIRFTGGLEEDDCEEKKDDGNEKKDDNDNSKEGLFIIFIGLIAACILVLLIASLTVNRLKNSKIWVFELWKWCSLLLAVLGGGVIAYQFRLVIDFLIWKFWAKKKSLHAYYLYGIKKSFLASIWLIWVFLAWILFFDRGDKPSEDAREITNDVTRVLAGFLIGDAIWLTKTLLVQLVASFHVKNLFEKIQNAKSKREALIAIFKKTKTNSVETMKEFIGTISGKQLPELWYSEKGEKIKNVAEAKRAANEIFTKFAENEKYINLADVLTYVRMDNQQVRQHFQAAAEDTDIERIKRSAFRKWVVEVYREYESLNSTLKYRKTAVDELNKLASMAVLLLIIIVWLLFMGFITTQMLIFITTQLLLVVFMFGNTAKTLFEAIIFVFVQHPFDVGDRCIIDDVQMVVEGMEILTTSFLRYDGGKLYYPNSVLATKPIYNLYRSPTMMDSVEFDISRSILKDDDMQKSLRKKIKEYLKKNSRYWLEEHSLQFKGIESEQNKLTVALHVNHTISFHYATQRGKRRSQLVLGITKILDDLRIRSTIIMTGTSHPGASTSYSTQTDPSSRAHKRMANGLDKPQVFAPKWK
ncbi:mechanosensitive ion channel protein 9 [Ricinus communis]|uniref:mechanosensitive ion channel protein 9 n=1 Tax=Ricinus communis TaxID=3988 RepID=UPI00201A4113|nr:mechanosensitive ion channel protein 9 [Ricinus communis]